MNVDIDSQGQKDAAVAPAGGPVLSSVAAGQRTRMLAGQSFQFTHTLGNSPLLSLPAIRNLTKRMLDQGRYEQILFDNGTDGRGPRDVTAETGGAVLDALNDYDARKAWLRLTRVDEAAPEIGAVIEQFYRDLSEQYGRDIRKEVLKTFATLFVSSPNAVTPYHIDHTWNYLLQIRGSKTVHLFDVNDPKVISQVEREDWYGERALVRQKPDVAGIAYHIAPGDGVHHPVNAPHWVQNDSEISVSLSLGLCLYQSNRDARVMQTNYLLRRLGMNPRPPGASEWRDALKSSFIGAVSKRRPNSFEHVLFSGINRVRRVTGMLGLPGFKPARHIEIT